MVTLRLLDEKIIIKPHKLIQDGQKKAVWGMHDISARARLPKDIMTLSMPYNMVVEIIDEIDNSFIITDNWAKIKARNSTFEK